MLKQIQWEMETETHEDLVVKAIKELKKSPAKSVISSEWSMEHGLLCYQGKVYVLRTDLRWKIVALFQDSWTPQKMENPGVSLPELLVAANVQVHRQVHFHM